MPSLQSLRRKIAAFKNTQKITKAMKMVAAAEHGARMEAMDGATRNRRQLIRKVTLHYNKTCQTAITKELMDIVGGAEALK
jgi:F-type H+-transporting ATPase subunit gamma